MIKAIRTILVVLGFLSLLGLIYIGIVLGPGLWEMRQFDSKAMGVYGELASGLIETGNAAEATVWKVPVADGLTPEDVETTMKYVANEHNIKDVGELPLYKQVEAMSGVSYRFVKIYMFCNALTAAKMIDYSDAFSAYLPCRITLIQDKEGKLWLYTLNMDLMIHGGKSLPPELKKEAMNVKRILLDIMNRGAKGEF